MLKLVPMPIRNYFQLHGRMTRSQFLRWLGFLLAVYVIAAWLDLRFVAPILGYLPFEEVEERYVTWAAMAVLVVPYITANVRRLHDVLKSGWWMIFAIFPLLALYYSDQIAFLLYNSLTSGILSSVIPQFLADMMINWLPWAVIAIAIACYGPVIIWSLKKGSNEPNLYGARQ